MTTPGLVAHGPVGPADVWVWAVDPTVVLAVLALAVIHARGVRSLGRSPKRVPASLVASFYGGLGMLVVVLSGPVEALAATLFSAHMAQHLVLIFAVAPALAYSRPLRVIAAGLPEQARGLLHVRLAWAMTVARISIRPGVAASVHVVVLWAWHLPALYEAALRSDALHAAEHVTFLASAAAFWTSVLFPSRGPAPRLAYGGSILVVFVAGLAAGALGALLTFATTPLYPIHHAGVTLWSTTLLADQRAAGLVMWVPAGAVYLVAIAGLFLAWMTALDQHVRATEAAQPAASGHLRG